jgi:hypothetical protein
MSVGIICDLAYTRHHLFQSYFHAVENLYDDITVIHNVADLKEVDNLLFIGDDHYEPHKQVWMQPEIINYCNNNGIRVVALTNERILDSHFPWNVEGLKFLRQYNNLTHFANDVDDCEKLGLCLNRTAPSRHFAPELSSTVEKKNKAVFVGRTNCKSYIERQGIMRKIGGIIDIDIITTKSGIATWKEYVETIAGYRFIFSPIGNGNFFPMRFYEALAVGSIPIHQVRNNTLKYYDIESKFDDCIFFEDISELGKKIHNCTIQRSHNVLWMEDNLVEQLTKSKLL